jgi:hypothetical protein
MQNALTLEGIQSDETTSAAHAAGTTKEQSQSDDEASQVSGFSQRKRAVHAKHNKWAKEQQQKGGEGSSSARGGRGRGRGKVVSEEEEEGGGGLTDSDPEEESVPQNSTSSSSSTAALSRDRRYPCSLFAGAIQNQVRCGQCKQLSSKQDPIEDLELEISRSSSLENALVQFCAEEELAGENAYHCDRCKTKVAAMRRIQLHKVPPVLTVSFKRFAVNGPYASGQGGRTSARAAAAAAAMATAAVAPVLSPPPQGSSRGGLWGLFSASKAEGGANNNPAAGGDAAAKSKYDTSNSSSHNGGKAAYSRPRGGLQKIQHYVHYPEYVFCSIVLLFLFLIVMSLSLLSIYCSLSALSHTT